MIEPVRFDENGLFLLDQRRLPHEEVWVSCPEVAAVAEAIRNMVVRGAPALGITAAFGLAVAARQGAGDEPEAFRERLMAAGAALEETRPTAVNIAWAVRRVLSRAEEMLNQQASIADTLAAIETEARSIHDEDLESNQEMGRQGRLLIPDGARVLTHCNAGALATAGFGTALGVIRSAVQDGKKVSVLADETRPFLQGARLTAWELQQDGIPVTLITDSMAGALMARGEVDLVIVGADRIARNGDVANKIGTYPLAVLARRHGIPFYIAAPVSTIDPECASGKQIPLEERDAAEVTHFADQAIAPEGVPARNLAFDVTPAECVTAIITERGICRAPFGHSIERILGPVGQPEAAMTSPPVTPAPASNAQANQDEEDLFS